MTTFVGANLTKTYTASELATEGTGFGVGDTFVDKDGKRYKFILFNNGAGNVASVAGNAAYYYGASGAADAATLYTVTMDLTDAVLPAGAFMSVIADGSYGWIQTWGPYTATTAFTAGADGNAMTHIGAGADGTWDVSALVTDPIAGWCIDATTKTMFLTCP